MSTNAEYAEARAVVRAIERRFTTVTLRDDNGIEWTGPGFHIVSNKLWARNHQCSKEAMKSFLRDTGRTYETCRARLAAAYVKAFKSTGHLLGMMGDKIVLVRDETVNHSPRQDERANDWWADIKEWDLELLAALTIEVQNGLTPNATRVPASNTQHTAAAAA